MARLGAAGRTVAGTALVLGHDRLCWAFNDHGGLREVDLDDEQPRFARGGTWPGLYNDDLGVVRALDLPTWRRRSQYYRTERGQECIGASGGGHYTFVYHNRQRLALVRERDPRDAPAPRAPAVHTACGEGAPP
jgi:hypothetical protein